MIKKTISILLLCICVSNVLIAKDNSQIISARKLNQTDIGNPAIVGKFGINESGFDITAGGADIWGTKDEFHFSYQKLKGDFDFSVNVLGLSAANQYTKAGIMARVDSSDNSQHVYFQVFPDNSPRNKNNGGCEFQYRLAKGGEMKAIYPDPKTAGNQFNVAFPNTWIRLKRNGDIFESYFSNDNKTWKRYSTFLQKMPKELLVGLAVTSHNAKGATTAKFGLVQLKK
ncbi:MAG TPA: hypothetical protein VGK38_15245 [Prolixibacteraceae bacterium]|jgi:hypothetical protein